MVKKIFKHDLPKVFYRYQFNGERIIKTKVYRNSMEYWDHYELGFFYENGSALNHPERIRLGEYDGKRHCVFLEEDNAEAKAAEVFDMHYNNCIAEAEERVKTYILNRKALHKIMKGETNGKSV